MCRGLFERRYPYLSGGARTDLGTSWLRAGLLERASRPDRATTPVICRSLTPTSAPSEDGRLASLGSRDAGIGLTHRAGPGRPCVACSIARRGAHFDRRWWLSWQATGDAAGERGTTRGAHHDSRRVRPSGDRGNRRRVPDRNPRSPGDPARRAGWRDDRLLDARLCPGGSGAGGGATWLAYGVVPRPGDRHDHAWLRI